MSKTLKQADIASFFNVSSKKDASPATPARRSPRKSGSGQSQPKASQSSAAKADKKDAGRDDKKGTGRDDKKNTGKDDKKNGGKDDHKKNAERDEKKSTKDDKSGKDKSKPSDSKDPARKLFSPTTKESRERKASPSKSKSVRRVIESDSEEDFPPTPVSLPKRQKKEDTARRPEAKSKTSRIKALIDSDSEEEDLPPPPPKVFNKAKATAVEPQSKAKANTSHVKAVMEDSDEDLPPPPSKAAQKQQQKANEKTPAKSSSKASASGKAESKASKATTASGSANTPPSKSTPARTSSKKSTTSKRPRDDDTMADDEPNGDSSPPAKVVKTDAKTPDEKKKAQSASYFKYISRGGPKNLGAKTVPVGAPKCLENLTFVTTGVLESFERDDIVTIVQKYGGRVTTAVSGKTTYLLVGDEPGESKIAKANKLKVKTLTEDGFLELIRQSNPNQPTQTESQFLGESDKESSEEEVPLPVIVKKVVPTPPTTPSRSSSKRSRETKGSDSEPPQKSPRKKESSSVERTPKRSESKSSPSKPPAAQPSTSSASSSTAASGVASSSAGGPQGGSTVMWVDKYKPALLKSVVGQVGDKSNGSKLVKWLEAWFNLHGKSGEKVSSGGFGHRDPEGKTFKAVLLSGTPGIGKTTTAHLACKQLGYDYFELNASDTRNKKGLHEVLSDALTSEALTGFKEKSRRHVLIMDEVDGMSGNEDRGGIQELIGLIKTSRVPVICICNDRMHPKIRSLANYCFDLKFSKPTYEQLKAMVQSICYKEKMKLPVESVQQLISSTDHDVRQILHQLQLIKQSSSVAGDSLYNPKKDLRFGPWDVCRKVFSEHEHRGMSFQDKSSLFFHDYNIGPLFVHENYLKWQPVKAKGNKYKHMDRLKDSAASIATGDLVENLIRRSNNWSLLPVQSIFSSILPGEYMEGNEVSGISFPEWLGQNSHKGKISRLLQQIYSHVHLQVSGSLEALNMDYLPYLHKSIVKPLVKEETTVPVELMHEYCLLREDLDSISEVALWPGMKNPMESVATKVKTAFTRGVNKEQLVPYSVVKVTKKRGGRAEGEVEYDEEGVAEDEDEQEEEEEPVEKDAMIKIRSSKKKSDKTDSGKERAGSSKSSSSRSSSSKSGDKSRSSSKKK